MNIEELYRIVAALRDPVSGCPWDKQQDFKSIAAYTLEEAYEVIDAIERDDYVELKDELGDLLLQVVFHAQLATERGLFQLQDVIAGICGKMIRRHPHVFQTTHHSEPSSVEDVKYFWEQEKARERAEKDSHSALADIALVLPALKRAQKLQKRAANVGFDWPNIQGVKEKIHEELNELEHAGEDKTALHEELGDLLFTCVNLARHLDIDAESCLMAANRKFEMRFQALEHRLRQQNKHIKECSLQELDAMWNAVKHTDN